ncbi:hypothetical protein RSOLAG1IB_12471 [Rhizoctonia solani AG-1 IB]|uniref:NACHT domain-containing protein n=1 Tax=Thanatephorus cucumeris (strain AG1-IB / isolate 7/3/14) TaxID=1108050 RepID=A0A0B7FZ52_THACB|nr:hypothetical protein RSOLAG1IB_12471 [Rhizoctonia solani AG-1 IB]
MTNGVKLIYKDLEEESNKVAEKQARATGRRLIDAMEELSGIEESYRRIGAHLQRLMLNTSLNMLKEINEQTMESRLTRMCPSMSAVYNSAESSDVQRGACAPGTRQAQIALLLKWTRAADAGKTCWMNGMAGTGKTTITYSVCKELEITCRLGASFFCSRTIPECRQVKYIIPSLAYQLAEFSLPFRCALSKALELDRDAHTRALDVQYQKLIVEPLTEVRDSLPADFIVVIDALDECENEDAVGQILELLLSAKYTLPIRYLISSRPEKEITRRITGRLDGQEEARLVLHNLDSIAVSKDIEAYMRAELKDVPLTEAQWQRLIDCCGALFIYASTTCRYIKQANELMTLNEAVGVITSSWVTQRDRNAIDDLYKIVLDDAFNKAELDDMNKQRMKDVLDTVVCAIEPMTVGMIAKLLGLESGAQVDRLLLPLRSVLNVTKTTGLVTTLHASFPDFILSFDRSKSYHCQSRILHFEMARVCLRLIDTSESKFNICALPSSHLLDSEIEDLEARVSRLISPGLTYACRYWSTHLRLGEYRVELLDCVSKFFSSRLLLWMEILNLTKHMRYGPTIIQDAEKWCIQQKVPEHLTKLAHDAWQFASFYAHHPLSQSTPHIYVSMLPFWPPSRPISTAYMPRTSGVVQPAGTAIDRRQLLLIATWQVSTHSRQHRGSGYDHWREFD